MSKEFLIDDIKFTLFHANNAPSCEVCGYHQSHSLVDVTSKEDRASISVCEDCLGGIIRAKDIIGNNLFIITATLEKY